MAAENQGESTAPRASTPPPTAIQTNPPATPATTELASATPESSIVKKRRRQPMSGAQVAAWMRRLDICLVAIVLIAAFLQASFMAKNSDVWMHLATGRLITEWKYPIGQDPFSFTTQGVYWANHSWLYDLVTYG